MQGYSCTGIDDSGISYIQDKKQWFMKYMDVGKICKTMGPEICSNLLAIHVISGYDTTSYMHRVGK